MLRLVQLPDSFRFVHCRCCTCDPATSMTWGVAWLLVPHASPSPAFWSSLPYTQPLAARYGKPATPTQIRFHLILPLFADCHVAIPRMLLPPAPQGCLAALPHHLLGERAVLGALARSGPSAWAAALLAVPRTLRMMYLHAWQSYVWNAAASHRQGPGAAAAQRPLLAGQDTPHRCGGHLA